MTNHQYSVALTVTYVPYIAAELPANLLLKVSPPKLRIMTSTNINQTVGANYMLPAMVVAWGLATAMQGRCFLRRGKWLEPKPIYTGVVTTYKGLLICRAFLGLAEG